ncbi:MAG: hypothetical protein ABI779_03665 [Acidobacteriota bacterium]
MRHLALALTVVVAASTASAHEHGSYDHVSSAEECSERNVHFGDGRTYVKKEIVDGSRLRSLKASVSNAPISVVGGSSSGYQITACKAAASLADLDAIRVTLDGNTLQSSGPANKNWTVLYHISAPRGAELDLSAQNGPLSIRDLEGNVVARAKNGPLSLSNVDGNVDASTTNGPISVSGGSGTVKVEATNGPLSVTLDGGSFRGSLDASTQNGPLSVKVPRGYASGVVVESRGRGPISCKAEDCDHGWRSDDDGEPRRIELGRGTANVHLSTVNGPVTIKNE